MRVVGYLANHGQDRQKTEEATVQHTRIHRTKLTGLVASFCILETQRAQTRCAMFTHQGTVWYPCLLIVTPNLISIMMKSYCIVF